MSMNNKDITYVQTNRPCPAGLAGYIIRPGDTLYLIAQRLGTTATALLNLNPGINPDALQIGQQICVPSTGLAPGVCPGGTLYTIRSGDTFYNLAVRFGLALQDLLAANPGVDPNRLAVGQTVCIPNGPTPTPVLIPTPFCSLLQPNFSVLPPDVDIPIGSVIVRQVAMSTRAYTVVAAPLPNPSVFGNYDSYVGMLDLITDDPAEPRMIVNVRLTPASFGNQLTTWAGTIITTPPPIVGDLVEIRPLNSYTGSQGPALLHGGFTPCRS
ncbi:MAG TPA: LysM peptidoglycan-binding domain-containing protein [Bacillota bacterium]